MKLRLQAKLNSFQLLSIGSRPATYYCSIVINPTTKTIFKASALWADAFYKSKCPSVCPSVCLSVCSLLRYHLNVFLALFPKVGCPQFSEIWNPWGKVMERSGLRLKKKKTFSNKGCKIAAQTKSFFVGVFRLSYH